jgi:hypothetical protein
MKNIKNTIFHRNRHGAEAARGAHNSEVTRSKRVAGKLFLVFLV